MTKLRIQPCSCTRRISGVPQPSASLDRTDTEHQRKFHRAALLCHNHGSEWPGRGAERLVRGEGRLRGRQGHAGQQYSHQGPRRELGRGQCQGEPCLWHSPRGEALGEGSAKPVPPRVSARSSARPVHFIFHPRLRLPEESAGVGIFSRCLSKIPCLSVPDPSWSPTPGCQRRASKSLLLYRGSQSSGRRSPPVAQSPGREERAETLGSV